MKIEFWFEFALPLLRGGWAWLALGNRSEVRQ